MNISPGHFSLTPEQRRFKALLAGYPTLQPFWDFDKRECDIDRLRQVLGTLSHGEAVMARFLAGVWLGENVLAFDMVDAAQVLNDEHRQVIINWLSNPEFP